MQLHYPPAAAAAIATLWWPLNAAPRHLHLATCHMPHIASLSAPSPTAATTTPTAGKLKLRASPSHLLFVAYQLTLGPHITQHWPLVFTLFRQLLRCGFKCCLFQTAFTIVKGLCELVLCLIKSWKRPNGDSHKKVLEEKVKLIWTRRKLNSVEKQKSSANPCKTLVSLAGQ